MSEEQGITMEIGQRFPLTIKRFGIDGEGIGYYKRQVVFVDGLIPEEEAVVEVTALREKHAQAKVVRIRKASKDRVEPPCPVYDECGGCQLQHVSYPGQLQAKKDQVIQAMERYTKIPMNKVEIFDTVGMEDPWHYRNKSQMQVGTNEEGEVIAGLYAKGSHELVDIDECLVQHPLTNEVNLAVKQIIRDLKLSIYDRERQKGLVRSVVVRTAFETDEWQLTLVISKKSFPKQDQFVRLVTERFPQVTSISLNINTEDTPLIFGEQSKLIHGSETIRETLGDIDYHLSPRSFFQLNPQQTKKLYEIVKEAGNFTGKEKVVDAYCGVGSIGLWLAGDIGELRGMDTVPQAVENANANAKAAGADSAVFETGTAEEVLLKWQTEGFVADTVIVDPPRSGLDQPLLETIAKVKPKQLLYVSCNPSTLAKNINDLMKNGYKVKSLQPVDMFPQTAQTEVVAVIELI
ncbi:23S rRNA (uracil(1939)-C(5))-methyltransferase RlmD [Salisediminibacterium beveridgei]|uniref:RNA methyltransferase, TrmA family n=1 Tax=Salisediminibacterium beveridgei TaxID=632773 RepID=A0A1D7QXE6_9BACI|nr:23S rRNA (uracil(1939)-C(5))-methyltransferase RlmD [Salisediminibacterium beveridgei]AOM83680.1 RNA methyltransferase, TrmA family [Salisediminibacterium beveridgei]